MKIRLEDKVVLITGTGGGQGRAAALLFAAAGARVIGCDLKIEGNEETANLVAAAGGSFSGEAPIDLGDRQQARDWVARAAALHGRIDILYNNASAVKAAPFEDETDEDWDFTMRNELDLVITVTRAAWPHLRKRGGVVITTASAAAIQPIVGVPAAAHGAAKAAVIALTRQLAAEGASHGIRCVSISPGYIQSPGAEATGEFLKELCLRRNFVGRLGQPEDVASAALFLASDHANYITGADLIIDGGFTLG
ncbi:MAG TPA: SDR family oxidoreductase [Allosphingosinicella sp.]|nr:SDR family oxidoreductase [Allosphingosinicella sp.]